MKVLRIISMHDLDAWRASSTSSTLPGGEMPYGMQALGETFDLVWSDKAHRGPYASRPVQLAGGLVRRVSPGLRGLVGAAVAARRVDRANAVLSIFENAGMAFARWQRLLPASKRVPHVMMVCWLAEDSKTMSAGTVRSMRRSLRSVDAVIVFSTNQIDILGDFYGIDRARIHATPFGVDTGMYDPSLTRQPGGGGGVLAVGSDSRRDYATLFEAARQARMPITVACQPRNIAGLEVPPEVNLVMGAYDVEYRRLLHSADLVVTCTTAPAYPSGQSVVLEAMSMGKATLTTDSPAMREYVDEGANGMLMPPRDPMRTALMMTELMTDDARRQALGARAHHDARSRFSLDVMWDRVANVINSVSR